MIKQTRMAQEAETQSKNRSYVSNSQAWEQAQGTEFGGQAEILEAKTGEVVGPFEYIGSQPIQMEGGKTVVGHIALDAQGEQLRMPIAASFLRAVEAAGLHRGDTFLAKRLEDARKKSGVGKGTVMAIWSIKVLTRVQQPA